ncbi:MAG: ATP-binding protein [Gemmatimonadales bacterium]|nr:ATP-binding protein [Gemmatimonadales bacterium]
MPVRPARRSTAALYARFLLTSACLLLLICGGLMMLASGMHREAERSAQVNLAGRQRMLSQRIPKALLVADRAPADRTTALAEADSALAELRRVHVELTRPAAAARGGRRASPRDTLPTAAGPFADLADEVVALDAAAAEVRAAIVAGTPPPFARLAAAEHDFLTQVHPRVLGMQAEALDAARQLQHRATVIALATAILLLVQGVLVLWPSIHKVDEALAASEELNRDLALALEDAKAAARAKAEFLATMSHELRTPLNAVIGFNSLLEQQGLPPQQAELVSHARRGGELLLGVINDILDFSRLEAGKVELETVEFDPREPVQDVVALLAPHAAERHVALLTAVRPGTPVRVTGDARRVRQVLLNLLGNAVKFTEHGRADVVVLPLAGGTGPDGIRLRFEVHDTGIGIAPEAQARLFHAFEQADGSTTRRFGGTGLGLAISRRLVELMGGTIGVASEPGRGSTFWFEVPLALATAAGLPPVAPAPPAATAPPPPVPGPGLPAPGARSATHILVVDDDAVNRRLAVALLTRLGHEVTACADGPSALAALDAWPVDLVLLDCQMPGMDGFEVARAIRARPEAGARLPVLALTASVRPEEQASCLEAGMDAILMKPIHLAALRDGLAPWLPAAAAA